MAVTLQSAQIAYESDRYEEAIDICQKILSKPDKHAYEANITLGLSFEEMKQMESAEKAFVSAIQIDLRRPRAWKFLAELREEQNLQDEDLLEIYCILLTTHGIASNFKKSEWLKIADKMTSLYSSLRGNQEANQILRTTIKDVDLGTTNRKSTSFWKQLGNVLQTATKSAVDIILLKYACKAIINASKTTTKTRMEWEQVLSILELFTKKRTTSYWIWPHLDESTINTFARPGSLFTDDTTAWQEKPEQTTIEFAFRLMLTACRSILIGKDGSVNPEMFPKGTKVGRNYIRGLSWFTGSDVQVTLG